MKKIFLIISVMVLLAMASCSGAETPIAPDTEPSTTGAGSSHTSWGLWQMIADPVAGTLEAVQLHSGEGHLNVIVFLEPPPLINLTLEYVEFNGDEVIADIGLRHPFLGLDEFTGFDVSGILISNGSYAGYNDSTLRHPGPGDTYLTNPDGHARWWNPSEFPHNPSVPIDGYNDGLLGAPDSHANFNSTLNGYKYYTEGLDATDSIETVDHASRGYFTAGHKNVRRFLLKLGSEGMIFNYAIDACWAPPSTSPPGIEVPGDFPLGANRAEPWRITVTQIENSLYWNGSSGGGQLHLQVHVWDWYDIENDSLFIPGSGIIDEPTPTLLYADTSTGHAAFDVVIDAPNVASDDPVPVVIAAKNGETGFQGHVSGEEDATYYVFWGEVGDNQPPVALAEATSQTGISVGASVDFNATASYDPDGTVTQYLWDFDEDGVYGDTHTGDPDTPTAIFNTAGTFMVDLKVIDNTGLEDTLDEKIEVDVSDFSGCTIPGEGYGYKDDAYTGNDGKECAVLSGGYYVTEDDNYGMFGCELDLRLIYYDVNSADCTYYVLDDDNICEETDDWYTLPDPSVVQHMDSWLNATYTDISDDLVAYVLDVAQTQVIILHNLSVISSPEQLVSINVGYQVIAFDFAQNGDLWVLDANDAMHRYVKGSSYTEAAGDSFSLPGAMLGDIFDFAICWANDNFYVFTDNHVGGTIYRLSSSGSLLGNQTNALRIGLENSGAGHAGNGDIEIDHTLLVGESVDYERCRILAGGGGGGSTNYSMLGRWSDDLSFISAFESNSSDHNGIGYIMFDPHNHRLWTGGATYAPAFEAWANSWRPIPGDW